MRPWVRPAASNPTPVRLRLTGGGMPDSRVVNVHYLGFPDHYAVRPVVAGGGIPMVVVGNYRNRAELRKKPRRQFHYLARIVTENQTPQLSCSIADISESGA